MYVCMYVAFKNNPQVYRRLSSSTACGIFRRGNYAYLSVSLFSVNRFNDGMSTSFGLGWVSLFFLSPFADAASLDYPLIYFIAQSYTHVCLRGMVWSCSSFILFFPGPCARGHALCAFFNYLALPNHWLTIFRQHTGGTIRDRAAQSELDAFFHPTLVQ